MVYGILKDLSVTVNPQHTLSGAQTKIRLRYAKLILKLGPQNRPLLHGQIRAEV